MDGLVQTVVDFLCDEVGTQPSGPIVVAVSGGIDSMALLHILYGAKRRYGWPLCAVHVNHGLRSEAGHDEAFVKETCAKWGIPLYSESISLKDIPRAEQRGVEADARRLRYEVLYRAVRDQRGSCLVLGHHANDQVETVLWRLARGTSLTGLAGLRPARVQDGIRVLRPFLRFSKQELAVYAKAAGVPHVEDQSNESREYTRNYIRHEVVPRLAQVQPDLPHVVHQMTQVLREEDAYLEEEAKRFVANCVISTDGGYCVPASRLEGAPLALQRRAIKILLYCLATKEWTFDHVEHICNLAKATSPSTYITLPGGFAAWREYNELRLGRLPPDLKVDWDIPWELRTGGELRVEICPDYKWLFRCEAWNPKLGLQAPDQWTAFMPDQKSVRIRNARPGERVSLLGMQGSKKVQDLYVDLKVPRLARPWWPVLVVDENIAWIPGVARSRHLLLGSEDVTGWCIRAQRM